MDIEKLKESFEFSHASTTPLYMQLASFFKICIQSEVLKIDEQLPQSEQESISKASHWHRSRTTVRQTMDLLIKEGYLLRVRAKRILCDPPETKPFHQSFVFFYIRHQSYRCGSFF